MTDYHVHIGQYNDKYFAPEKVVQDLAARGVNEAWVSSTTSCIYCKEFHPELQSQPTARQIQDAVCEEMCVAILEGEKCGVKVHPLFWLVPEFENCGVYFEEYFAVPICDDVFYEGFKIHPRAQVWNFCDEIAERAFSFAEKNNLRILIHTGNDQDDSPRKFEAFINAHKNCLVQLAHLKNLDSQEYMLKKYENVVADSAFSGQNAIDELIKRGIDSKRILFGSDFPINPVL